MTRNTSGLRLRNSRSDGSNTKDGTMISLRLTRDELATLDAAATRAGKPRSDLIRAFIAGLKADIYSPVV